MEEDTFKQFLDESLTKEQQEEKESNQLIEKGFFFNVGKRELHIKPLVFGTIAQANKYAVDLKINILSDDNASVFKEVNRNIDPLMKFIAVCVLAKPWKIKLFSGLLAKYLKWKLNPQTALKITLAILQMYDIANFITSIRLIGQTTITNPRETNLVDGKAQVSNPSTEH
ncbi:hypothetical protein [Chryseobacterium aquaticum]|uniref:Uncharacterized protein n=1 Tax=Chryseobacterium aquaticum subsp. greenlandense TaxID=345663 RepID=A0A101CHN8_9FLAO|nr:hypothetical protein [Chryseobacterium aquaticum]KUJ56451.1 hypothetical protein AR686_07770 [Chryseobacterium aquaticum subsp. greenlandense]